jgi:hypothetical protein
MPQVAVHHYNYGIIQGSLFCVRLLFHEVYIKMGKIKIYVFKYVKEIITDKTSVKTHFRNTKNENIFL